MLRAISREPDLQSACERGPTKIWFVWGGWWRLIGQLPECAVNLALLYDVGGTSLHGAHRQETIELARSAWHVVVPMRRAASRITMQSKGPSELRSAAHLSVILYNDMYCIFKICPL